ncbi:MAG: TetR family transcriptional regulator [Polyangiales bacterium]
MGNTRQRILAEATRQLTEVGYPAFTVAAVRDALTLSSGSMFHAFASKAALAAAVYVEGMAAYQRVAVAAIAAAPDAEGALRAFIAAHLAWIEDHQPLARYLFDTLPDDVAEHAQAPLAAHNAAFFAALEGLFRKLERAGLCGKLEHAVAHVLCIGPAHEYGRLWTRGSAAQPPRELTRAFQDAALAALVTTVTTSARRRPRKQEVRS